MNDTSCIGCKFLYAEGTEYSNYTWEATDVRCAKDRNPNLPAEQPEDWCDNPDNWQNTKDSRCELYAHSNTDDFVLPALLSTSGFYLLERRRFLMTLDVEGYDGPADYTDDEESILAICAHSGRPRKGLDG